MITKEYKMTNDIEEESEQEENKEQK